MRPKRDLFRITTRAVLFNDKDEVLILKNSNKKTWSFPGGHAQHHEQISDALIREVKEETNLSVKTLTPLDIFIDRKKFILFYLVQMLDSNIILSEEHTDYAWVFLRNLEQYDLDHPSLVNRAELGLKIRTFKKHYFK